MKLWDSSKPGMGRVRKSLSTSTAHLPKLPVLVAKSPVLGPKLGPNQSSESDSYAFITSIIDVFEI